MNGRFSEEPKEPSANIKMHKKSGSKQNAFSFLPTFKKINEKWKKNKRLKQCLRLIKLKCINQNSVMFVDSPHI